jgi:hypothetical protein
MCRGTVRRSALRVSRDSPCHMRPQERSCPIEYPTGRRTPPRSWRCIWRSCRNRRASMLCAAVVLAACCRVRAFALVILTDVVPGRVRPHLRRGNHLSALSEVYALDSSGFPVALLDGRADVEVRRSPTSGGFSERFGVCARNRKRDLFRA